MFSGDTYFVKSVQTQSFLWSVFSLIPSEYRKIWTRKNYVLRHFKEIFTTDSCHPIISLPKSCKDETQTQQNKRQKKWQKCGLICHHLNNVTPVFCRPIFRRKLYEFHGAKISSVLSGYIGIKVTSDVHAKAG